MRALVKQAIEDGYVNGLVQGGIPADEVSEDDALMIIELDTQQQDFIPDFVKAVRDARKDRELQQSILDTRIPLWVASVEAAGMAGLNSAKANEMVTWKLGNAEHHCTGPNSCKIAKPRSSLAFSGPSIRFANRSLSVGMICKIKKAALDSLSRINAAVVQSGLRRAS